MEVRRPGGLDFDYPGFVHIVLVDLRARLGRSPRPNRIFEITLEVAQAAGLVGHKRVLDATPLYDAVATMDTVTLVRSAIRGLLAAADAELEGELRSLLSRDDDYASAGKPVCDYDDPAAREALVDALADDAMALLTCLHDRELGTEIGRAAELLATVVGQDLDSDGEGLVRIASRVATDRVISTVDPAARHGHKTSARGFDGYKAHVALEPDSEIITATTVTAGNTGDAEPAADLLADELATHHDNHHGAGDTAEAGTRNDRESEPDRGGEDQLAVYGDAAYGSSELLHQLEAAGADIKTKVQPPPGQGSHFTKDRFTVDRDTGTVTCPNQVTVPIRPTKTGGGNARFGTACTDCPLAAQCTTSKSGRTIAVSRHEAELARVRAAQTDPDWGADYRATRPKVERKIGHLMRRRHGGRRARVRGYQKVTADFALLAATANLARLGTLGLRRGPGQTWTAAAI